MDKQPRYRVQYGSGNDYAVLDTVTGNYVFTSASKSKVIAESQLRNKFEPVDGDEQTYGKQMRAARSRTLSNPLAERFT